VRVDVRIVAATHQPLEQRVAEGLFREDLFHRLNVIRLRLPPLRERVEDIPGLAQHFLTQSARSLGVPVKRLTPDAVAELSRFEFPGNVRQLENFCHWLTVMAAGQTIDRNDLPPEIRMVEHRRDTQQGLQEASSPDDNVQTWQDALLIDAQRRLARGEPAVMATLTRQFERILLRTALDASRGRRVEAASRLGIGRNTITRKLRELGLEEEI
jgi:two-component system nitrogen regulation response regulator GlnG